jgi:hypothetical protein
VIRRVSFAVKTTFFEANPLEGQASNVTVQWDTSTRLSYGDTITLTSDPMLKNLFGWMSCALAILIFTPGIADADPPASAQGGQNMVTEFKGALKSFQRGVLLVTKDDGTEMMVQPPDDVSKFQFVATAKPAFLTRGILVRFSGTFNQAGVPQAPISRVEVFQPITGKVPGHTRERFIPGVYPERSARNQPPQPIAKYDVVGALVGLDASGIMAVQAGKRPVRVQLTPDTTLELRVNNLSLAQEGDAVSVAGFYQPGDETKVKADRVTITTDRIYGEPGDQPKRAPRRTSRRTKKPADENPAGENPSTEKGDQPEAEQKDGK